MEHANSKLGWSQIKTVSLLILTIVLLTSCRQRADNPELLDPIYGDLHYEWKFNNEAALNEQTAIDDLQNQIKALPPRDPLRKQMAREIASHERELIHYKQLRQYYEIRREQRKKYVLKSYEKAFLAEQPWPDPQEYVTYKSFKKLRQASRNWGERVPKTTRYQKREVAAVEEKPKGEGKGEGGHEGGGEKPKHEPSGH